MTDQLPESIARYSVEALIGSGAMGQVYRCHDPRIERPVAIKVLHPHLRNGEQGEELMARFLLEAKAAARCLHTNIITVFDYGNSPAPYIVMEYVEGTELKTFVRNRRFFPLPTTVNIGLQILAALSHAHSNGVIHRDIKPANIMILNKGHVKVSDFGVARLDASDLTCDGYMVGTPNYMAPEALRGADCDERSDLYSVAVVLFEMLTHCKPNRDAPLAQTLDLLRDIPDLPEATLTSLQALFQRGLQLEAKYRFQTADEFTHSLRELVGIESNDLDAQDFSDPGPDNNLSLVANNATSSQWNQDLRDHLESSLAPFVGPVARLLVRKSCNQHHSLEELISDLTQHIPTERERTQFVRKLERSSVSCRTRSQDNLALAAEHDETCVSQVQINEALVADLKQALTYYMGPLAGRVVQRAANRHLTPASLIDHLSQQIPSQRERIQFLERAHKLIARESV